MTKEIIIIALIVLVIYLFYQQNNQPNISDNSQAFKELEKKVQHYQTLYENRVKKDLGLENKDKETQTEDDQLKIQHQEQLRKINLLFDEKAQDYQFIDFNGLYSLLQQIAERERENKIK